MKTSQLSMPLIILVLIFIAFNIVVFLSRDAVFGINYFITIGVSMLILALFYKMDIVIDRTSLRIIFGIGLIRRTFVLASIESMKLVKNPWWAGWGIRYTFNYTLYNAAGVKAVELSFKNSSRCVRIGSENPETIVSYFSGAK